MVPFEKIHDLMEELRLLEAMWLLGLDATDNQCQILTESDIRTHADHWLLSSLVLYSPDLRPN